MWKRPCRRQSLCYQKKMSRASPNDTDGLTKGWVFNGDNYATGILRQQSGSEVMILGGIIGMSSLVSFVYLRN